MRRLRKWALRGAAIAILLPAALVVCVLLAANTDPGRRFIERETAVLSFGQVTLARLSGRFPDALAAGTLTIRDRDGVWLVADGVAADWSPIALLRGMAVVDNVTVARLRVARLPLPAAPQNAPPRPTGFSLPVGVDVRHLAIARAELGARLAGVAAVLRIGGSASVASLHEASLALHGTRLDADGDYSLAGTVSAGSIDARLAARETAGGLLAAAAKLPALGAIQVNATIAGARRDEHVQLAAQAGPMRLSLAGRLDLPASTMDVTIAAAAPAMQPRADVKWQRIELAGHAKGAIAAPRGQAHLAIDGLTAGGAQVAAVRADVSGSPDGMTGEAVLDGTVVPGAQPNLFADAPITLAGSIALRAPGRPARFDVHHRLLSLTGDVRMKDGIAVDLAGKIPDLAPFAALAKTTLSGSLAATAQLRQHGDVAAMVLAGSADITGGRGPLPALFGTTRFAAAASLHGQDMTIDHVNIDGRALHARLAGTDIPLGLDLNWQLSLPDLALVAPRATGALVARGHVAGAAGSLQLDATLTGTAGSNGFAARKLNGTLHAEGMPRAPHGMIHLTAAVQGAPLAMDAKVQAPNGGAINFVLQRAVWKSLSARADISLPAGQAVPIGTFDARIGRLGDIGGVFDLNLSGEMRAALVATQDSATIKVDGHTLAAGPRRIGGLSLAARAAGPIADPDIAGTLTMTGIEAGGVTARTRIRADGKIRALALDAVAQTANFRGAPAYVALSAVLDGRDKQVVLRSTTANWKGLALRQAGPARIDFGARVAIDRLRLALNKARLALDGRISPALDLTASLDNVTPDVARPFMPNLAASGVLTATSRLTGTVAAPRGQVRVAVTGLRGSIGPASAMPAASLHASATLAGETASVSASFAAGPTCVVTASGTVPLRQNGAMDVTSRGSLDLALLNPVLEAVGRAAAGKLQFAMNASGALAAPRLNGRISLADGSVQDYAQGLRLTKMKGRVLAAGDTLQISGFQAAAGPGSLSVTGTVGAFAPGLPVNLLITAQNAQPLASDLLTARFDARLTLAGALASGLRAGGTVLIRRMGINVPDSLPPSVVVLHVHKPGDQPQPPAPAAPASAVALDVSVDAPGNIFVRGKGLDAELGGRLTVTGSSASPRVTGGFDLRRGDFSLAGTTLIFSKGSVNFNGTGLAGKIDPTLDFEADSVQATSTATLKVTGYADAPKIALASVPELPQDEILARLLFGQSLKQLSPFQIAEIGAALAELSGITGSGGPLASLRKGLGLDRLTVGGGTNGAGARVEAGRYVAKGVYLGARQAAGGAGGTQAQVQVDLTRHLKLQTTLGTGGGTVQGPTPQNDPGSSVGVSYQFDY